MGSGLDWSVATILIGHISNTALHIHAKQQEIGYLKGLNPVFYCTVIGKVLLNSNSTVTRIATNAVIGAGSETVSGIGTRFAGTMITSDFDIEKSFDNAFDIQNIVFDAALGGAFGGIQGVRNPGIVDGELLDNIPDELPSGVKGASGAEFSETFDNWDDMKNAHKGTVTQFVKDNKPLGSTHPRDWLKNGGSLTIDTLDDGTQIWKYTKDGITVPYVPKMINGKMQNVVKFPDKYLYKIEDVFDGTFEVPEGFTGNRTTDMKNAIKYLDDTYGIDKIPKGYILHHDIDNGVYQLVRNDVHSGFSHYGGHYYNK